MKRFCLAGCLLILLATGCGPREEPAPKTFTGKVETTLDAALATAQAEKKPVLVVAYQGNADMIDRNLLNDDAIKRRNGKFITAKLDANSQSQAISQLGINQFPAMIILRADGTEAWRSGARMPFPGEIAIGLDQAGGAPAAK